MTDRRRKGSNAENHEVQLWSALKTKLDTLAEVQSRAEESVSTINTLQAQWVEMENNASDEEEEGEDRLVNDDKDDERRELRERLMQAYSRLRQETTDEKSMAAEAMESLGILVALRAPDQSQPVPVVDLNKRKKRRLDNDSPAPSDGGGKTTSSARNSPAPMSLSLSRGGSRNGLSISTSSTGGPMPSPSLDTANGPPPLTAASNLSLSSSQPHSARSGSLRPLTKKERKALLDAQLPLKEGRPVAFKPPNKGGPKGAKNEAGSTDWIQARVMKCIGNDKNRYEVQDVDDAEGAETKPGAIYQTTLKALLPLPDPRDRSTYPPQPYAVGSEVIALYPETTSFYRARIVGLPGNGKSPKYKLVFEEDNEEVKTVSVDHVVDPQDKQ